MLLVAAFAVIVTACNAKKNTQNMESQKNESTVLVAYFSATGTTAEAAKKLASVTGGVLHEIQPEQPYTKADLNWNDDNSRSTLEMKDKKSRPAIKNKVEGMERYQTIYVGFPIWWGIAPTIVNTFLEQYNLEGKTIIPFFTSGGSDKGETLNYLKPSAPKAVWKEPINLTGQSEAEIKKMIAE